MEEDQMEEVISYHEEEVKLPEIKAFKNYFKPVPHRKGDYTRS
jgi:hypothetical protein